MNRPSPNDGGLRPVDDGACDHLISKKVPDVKLFATDHQFWNLGDIARAGAVIYVYPATGLPGKDPAPGWDNIPGAPGCTVQSIGFRDLHRDFRDYGLPIFGISTQTHAQQQEFSIREKIPFALLSDPKLKVRSALQFPFFEVDGRVFYRRVVLLLEVGRVSHVFYPVFPPDLSASTALNWLRGHRLHRRGSSKVP